MRTFHRSTIILLLLFLFTSCKKNEQSIEHLNSEDLVLTDEEVFLELFPEDVKLDGFESCGFAEVENSAIIPFSLATKFDLGKMEMYNELKPEFQENKEQATYFSIAKKTLDDEATLLLYGFEFESYDRFVEEFRLAIFNGKEVVQNVLFCGNVADDGEDVVCRRLELYADRLEMIKLEEGNFPQHLSMKEKEVIFFDSFSSQGKPAAAFKHQLGLPLFIPYQEHSSGNNSHLATPEELEMIAQLGMSVSAQSTISTVGSFEIHDEVNGSLQRVIDGESAATILSTMNGNQLVSRLLVQKYVKGQSGYASEITEVKKLFRSEMFEINRDGELVPEVDHEDVFLIQDNGEILEEN